MSIGLFLFIEISACSHIRTVLTSNAVVSQRSIFQPKAINKSHCRITINQSINQVYYNMAATKVAWIKKQLLEDTMYRMKIIVN